ncbi:MAG: hypothetical protein LBE36_02910 [Flavobacteriaceae bacterium]|jgi:hypothetical protein|nr:hypothetical protein [Flavobacteriaceae bacterium]
MNITAHKKNIIQWVNTINDPNVLEQLELFRKEKPFDFDKEIKDAISGEELKRRTTEFLKSLTWKK